MTHSMRITPNDGHTAGPNPIRMLRFMKGMKAEAFAPTVGLKYHELMNIECGRAMHLKEDMRAGFKEAGYDFDKLRSDYATWRDMLVGGTAVAPASLDACDSETLAIQDALAAGIRGIRNISTHAKVPYARVRAFLQQQEQA
jgi:hypothetical protein